MRDLRLCVVALLLVVACGAPVSEAPGRPIRLIELTDDVEITWPRGSPGSRPEGLRPSMIGALEPKRAVIDVTMPGASKMPDTRAALMAPTRSIFRFDLDLPRDPLLRFAIGYSLPRGEATRELVFSIEIGPPGGEAEEIFRRQIETHHQGEWEEVEIDLGRWAEQGVDLVFTTTSPQPGRGWAAWAAPEVVSRTSEADGWDVILISLDTLRADHLSSYGHARPTSPNIDALASSGVRFATAVSQAPWTRPSHRSMLQGLYPVSHAGLRAPPVSYQLWRAGYRTGAITGGGQVDAAFGFQNGFEVYRVGRWLRQVDEVVSWLEAGRDRRDFLFLHTFEIHDPYTDTRFTSGLPGGRIESDFGNQFASSDFWANRDTTSEEKAYAEALYDGDIAFVDERLGVIFAELEQRDLLENCIIMITSDHGEQFWEHGSWRHGSTVYDHQLLVPLIMYLPEALREQLGMKPGKVIEQQVQLVDLVPTILDLVGVESAYELQGVSLRALLEGESTPPRRAFAEHTNVRTYERKAFRTEKYKVVYSFPKKKGTEMEPLYELYDLQADPLELNNIADQYPEFVQAQVEEMKILRRGVPAAPLEEEVPEGLDPDLVERLKALGYVDN